MNAEHSFCKTIRICIRQKPFSYVVCIRCSVIRSQLQWETLKKRNERGFHFFWAEEKEFFVGKYILVVTTINAHYGKTNEHALRTMHNAMHWNIVSVSLETLLRHINIVPGINSLMHYVGATITFFSCHEENEQLSSILHITMGHPSVWCVVPREFIMKLEAFLAKHLLHSELLNSPHGEIKQILSRKNIFCNPFMLKKRYPDTKISRIVQRSKQFIILGPGDYHGGCIVSYNVAPATNFADFFRHDTGKS